MRFTDNGDGTITDNDTGLMWQQQDDGIERTWQDAITYCDALTLAGHDDWRLPTVEELGRIVDYSKHDPAINKVFTATSSAGYWS